MGDANYDAYMASDGWYQVRRKVYARVARAHGVPVCEGCKVTRDESPGRFEVHHVDYRYFGRELAYWDRGASATLRLLCERCHAEEHHRTWDIDQQLAKRLAKI